MYNEEIKRNRMVFEIGDRVIYVPSYAKGDTKHPACEYGTIKSWNSSGIFVNYVKDGVPQMTAQHTRPEDLVLDGKGPGEPSVLEIFKTINDVRHS